MEFTQEDPNSFPGIFEKTIAFESKEALKIKENVPVMVVMGNPPYFGNSENKGDWILEQMKTYKQIKGVRLDEKNPKWLMDDYVKFFRFAQWKIEQSKVGVIGYITNHAWLDNPTFRGMRYSLLKTFDEIYILNLHGSTLKKETTPGGDKDENVFDITPGVAITIAVKNQSQTKQVFYHDVWGLREDKYSWLEKNDLTKTKWQKLNPAEPFYFFVPKDEKGREQYQKFVKITDVFPVNSVGVVTGRDEFVISKDKHTLESNINALLDTDNDDEFIKNTYKLKDKPKSKWFVKNARKSIQETKDWQKFFTRILYRPFDERWVFYHKALVERSRKKVMRHMFKPNLGILYTRPQSPNYQFSVLVSNSIVDQCVVGNKSAGAGISYLAPLYFHDGSKEDRQISLLETDNKKSIKAPNLNWDVLPETYSTFPPYTSDLTQEFIQQEESIFYYIYAILYSNIYRGKYQEFLKTDFPRIPFTTDYQSFKGLALLGERLVKLHLLQSNELNYPVAKCEGEEGRVEKIEYNEKSKLLWINATQFFDGIKAEVWNYQIGGYRVLERWLKDRKGRILSAEDIKHYCRIVTALGKTIEIQKHIDKLYPKVEKN